MAFGYLWTRVFTSLGTYESWVLLNVSPCERPLPIVVLRTIYVEKQRLENHLRSLLGNNDPDLIDLVLDFILQSSFSGKL